MKLPLINITNPMTQLLVQLGAYLFVFLFSLVFFIYLFFPYDRWKGDLEEILSEKTGKTFTIEEIDGWRLVGIKMKGVHITSPDEEGGSGADKLKERLKEQVKSKSKDEAKTEAAADDKGKEKPEEGDAEEEKREGTYVDSVAIRPAILSFLTGSKGVIFVVDIYGGDIDGKVTFGKKTTIDIDIDDIDVREISFLENLIGLPFIGEVNGKVDLEYTGKTASDMEGTVELEIDELRIGDKDSKLDLSKAGGGIIKGAIKFEPVEVGDLVLEMEGEEGRLKITKMEAASKHIEIMGGGDVRIAQPIGLSSMNLYVKFKFLDEYVQSSAMTKSVFSTLDRITKFRQAKRTDGFWGFAIRGTFSGGLKPIPAKVGPGGM